MDVTITRGLIVLATAFVPTLARGAYLYFFPNQWKRREIRQQRFVSYVTVGISALLAISTMGSNFSNVEFMSILMMLNMLSSVFHLALKRPFASEGERGFRPQHLFGYALLMVAILAMFLPIPYGAYLDSEIVKRVFAETKSPNITFVPISVELVYIDGEEYFQFRSKETSIRESSDQLLIVTVPADDKNRPDAMLIEEAVRRTSAVNLASAEISFIEPGRIPVAHAKSVKRIMPF